ncbi:MAG: MarR family transcriptional regulator [Solirubrobacteraceae bacterium]
MAARASTTGTAAEKRSPPGSPEKTPATTSVAGAGRARKSPSRATREEWEAELADLGKAFRRVFRGVRRLRGRDTHLLGSEVSHAQFELLIELFERGPLPAGELASAAQLTPGTVTQMLDHLAECGHVERERSQEDRRVVVTKLTSQGRRKVQDKRAAWQARWEQVLGDVDAEELRVATRVLERLSAVFEDGSKADECSEDPASRAPARGR